MLSKEQVDYLYDFCYSEGVTYFDIQTELVDHLANAIEREMADHPDRTFYQALPIVVRSFGDKKFKPLLVEEDRAARRHSQRIFLSNIKQQLSWPLTWVLLAGSMAGIRLLAWHDRQIVGHLFTSVAFIGWSINLTTFRFFAAPNSKRTLQFLMYINVSLVATAGLLVGFLLRDLRHAGWDPIGLVSNLFILGVSLVVTIIMVSGNSQEMQREVQTGKRFIGMNMTTVDLILVLFTYPLFFWGNRFTASPDSFYLLFFAALSFFYCLICLAYYRTVRQLRSRLKKEYPAAFPTVLQGR